MAYTANNIKAINAYWSEFNKSLKDKSTARCYHAVIGKTINNKISSFTDGMFINNKIERSTYLTNLVLMFWDNEINFIFENRRIIRENDTVSYSNFELFNWMKKTNRAQYAIFKGKIIEILQTISKNGGFSKSQIKKLIAMEIYDQLANEFIKL